MKSPIITVLLLLLFPYSVFAQINWKSRQLEISAASSEPAITADFRFTNSGEKAISISSVTTSCDCTTAELEKKVYAPGETGSIKAKFTIGSRTGVQQKVITVKSDDPSQPVTALILKVTIPQVVQVSPRFVFWNMGEKATSKTVTVKIVDSASHNVISATPTGDKLTAEVKEVIPGREYKIILTPKSAAAPFTEDVTLKLDLPAGRETYTFSGTVRDPRSTDAFPTTRPVGSER